LAKGFFARHANGIGISIWPLLGTRAHRLHAKPWLDLDTPEVAALRLRYLPPRRGWTQLTSCLCSAGKVATSHGGAGPRLFVLDESLLPLHGEAMMRVLDSIAVHAQAGSELVLAFDSHAALRRSSTGDALELALGTAAHELVRYPRLRFIEALHYPAQLWSSLCGVNAVARLQGADAPALAHLQIR
jgi:hypothetical protein